MGIKPKDLLELLEDAEVQRRIREIAGSKSGAERMPESYFRPSGEYHLLEKRLNDALGDNHALQEQLDKTQRELGTVMRERDALKRQYAEAQKQLAELETLGRRLEEAKEQNAALEQENEEYRDTLRKLKASLGMAAECWQDYRKLPEPVRYGLEDVICEENLVAFIASCTAESHFKVIWNHIADLLETDRHSAEVLKWLFDYFFAVFNESLPQPMYRRDDTEEGDEFDEDIHTRCAGSATSGEVCEVLLRGYYTANTHNTVCRSVVRI